MAHIRSEGGESNLADVIFVMQGSQNGVGDLSQATQEFSLLANVAHNCKEQLWPLGAGSVGVNMVPADIQCQHRLDRVKQTSPQLTLEGTQTFLCAFLTRYRLHRLLSLPWQSTSVQQLYCFMLGKRWGRFFFFFFFAIPLSFNMCWNVISAYLPSFPPGLQDGQWWYWALWGQTGQHGRHSKGSVMNTSTQKTECLLFCFLPSCIMLDAVSTLQSNINSVPGLAWII